MEGMVLGFAAEHNLPLAMAHHVVELANEMICNPIAAKKLRLA